MNILTVIPITKGLALDELTYFSAQAVSPGALVSVSIRNRLVDALVVKVQPAEELKSELRSSSFPLKKISKVKRASVFLPAFIESAREIADYYATTTGAVIKSYSTKLQLDSPASDQPLASTLANPARHDYKFVVQDSDTERAGFYKGLIREAFAKRQSTLLLLPSGSEVEKIKESFGHGIDDYTAILTNDLSAKEQSAAWKKALDPEHPVLIITTPSFLALPRADVKLIILDRESSGAYKSMMRPFTDARYAAETLAGFLGARLVLGDTALRPETIFRVEHGEFGTLSPLKYRSITPAHQSLVDLSHHHRPETNEPETISPALYQVLKEAIENNEQSFLFAARKGWSTATVCRDCATTVTCGHCSSPLVIHRLSDKSEAPDKNFYICHKCGEIRQPEDQCRVCGGSRLYLLGLGIERAEEELRAIFPHTKIFRLDSESARTKKQVRDLMKAFQSAPGSIMLGTELALNQLHQPVENVAIISIDPLFALPDFRINEKVLSLILRLRQLATKEFLLQTRNPTNKVIDYALKGSLVEFFREELAARKELDYPPNKVLIKITLTGKEAEVIEKIGGLEQDLALWQPLSFPAFTPKVRGAYQMHILLKLEPDDWPNQELLARLKALPPEFIVNVDPEDIL